MKKDLLKDHRIGFDPLALALVGVLLLPNLVSWILSGALADARPPYANPYAMNGVNIAAVVFLAVSLFPLLAVVRREQKKFSFFSAFGTFTVLALLLYYIAWIFFYCGYGNIAVRIFLAFCPAAALLCYEADRGNLFALPPTAIFAVLHVVATIVVYF